MDYDLMEVFEKVKPIVLNARKKWHIRGWELDDYLQEGLITLHQMLETQQDMEKLPVHFKVRYTRHLTSMLRKEKASKRYFDSTPYVALDEMAFSVADRSAQVDQQLLFEDTKSSFIASLNEKERENVEALLRGEKIDRMVKYRLRLKLIDFLSDND